MLHRIGAKETLQIFFAGNRWRCWTVKFHFHIIPHRVSVHLQLSSSLFRAAPPLSPGAATQVSFYFQDSPRYFPLPANWTITLVVLIPQKRIFARTAYFLAHPLFGSFFTLHSASAPISLLFLSCYISFFSFYLCLSYTKLSRISKCCTVVKTTNSDGKPLVTGCPPLSRATSTFLDIKHYGLVKEDIMHS